MRADMPTRPAQDKFCANTYCWITIIYDQSGKHNDLTQAPRGGFSGPAMGGFNNLPLADMAPVTIMGHKVYGVFIEPGMGLREDDAKGTAVDDQAEGQYWVINGLHFNNGCCFDYGNAETDSRDDDNGTMETAYYGDATPWFHGNPPGPWVMTDQENNLVGCANPDGSKFCVNLPSIDWRFVTAIAKGEPHHWTSMGGDAQSGDLSVMFNGPRVNATYDPMRKQGAILLGNGGDNSNGSQGTFYEGALTAAGTFPSGRNRPACAGECGGCALRCAAAERGSGIGDGHAARTADVYARLVAGHHRDVHQYHWRAGRRPQTEHCPTQRTVDLSRRGTSETSKTFADVIAPGASVSATFKVTSGPAVFNGDLVGNASWKSQASGKIQTEMTAEKMRNVSPVKVNEFRISAGPPVDPTDSFIELYDAGDNAADISNWTLTVRPTQKAIFSAVKIAAGTKLKAHGFYLLGLSDSGLAAAARAGDTTLYVRNTDGMTAGDTVSIGAGSEAETRKIASVGTAATPNTTLWQPLPEGPVITIPAGSTNVPVTSVERFQDRRKDCARIWRILSRRCALH